MYELNDDVFDLLPEEQQLEIIRALGELDRIREQRPLHVWFPHPKQTIFLGFGSRMRLFLGGNQSGKTTAGLADDLIQALPASSVPEHLLSFKRFHPPFLCRIFSPTDTQLETVTYVKLRELIPPDELMGGSWSKAYQKDLRILQFKCGSQFYFNTYRQEVAALGGSTLNRIHYDEEPPKDHRIESRIRVMRKGGDEIFTMTPVEGMTWMADDYWEDLEEHEVAPDVYRTQVLHDGFPVTIEAVTVDMDDNPTLTAYDKAVALEGLSKEGRAARKSGKFVAMHGLIYGDFDARRHVIGEQDPPEASTIVVGIDPGIRNKTGVVWLYVTRDDQMVVFHEGYYEGHTAGEVAREIHLVNGAYGIAPAYYVIDPAARNKEHITGRSSQMEYADHGIVAIAGQNDVIPGINRVRERLEVTLDSTTDAGFWIADNCPNLIREMRKYRWRKPQRTEDDPQEKPVKRDDHLLDALRYAVMSRPYLPVLKDSNSETELQRSMREHRERGQKRDQMARVGS